MSSSDASSERRLRILVVNWLDRENPQAGGAEEHLHQLFGRLARRGHDVTALVSGWPGCAPNAELDGIHVHRAAGRHSFSLGAPAYFRRELASIPFDVVVEDLNKIPLFTKAWVPAPVLLLAHHLFGVTAFQAASPPVAAATWLLERPIPWLYRGVPTVAVSESTKEDLVARGMAARTIDVIPNGIDIRHYTPGPDEDRAARPTLLFLGRLKQYKRVDLIIDAVGRLAEADIDVDLVIGGSGDQDAALRDLAQRRGMSDRVHFPGFVDEQEKLRLLRTSWLHVLTSPKEGWGITNLEAGACGTPTVASDSPGLRESVVNGRTGLLVPHGDLDRLVEALALLMTDHERRSRMGREARAFAEGFSWDAAADAFERRLFRVVAGPSAR